MSPCAWSARYTMRPRELGRGLDPWSDFELYFNDDETLLEDFEQRKHIITMIAPIYYKHKYCLILTHSKLSIASDLMGGSQEAGEPASRAGGGLLASPGDWGGCLCPWGSGICLDSASHGLW